MHDIELSPLDQWTLEWARNLHNDPDVLKMLTDPHVVTPEEQLLWFERLENSESSVRWVAFSEGKAIGVVRIDQLDKHNRSVCVGLDIHRDSRGKGYAKPIYRAVLQRFFEIENLHRVWLYVAAYNTIARNLYSSLGFKEEGVQRQALLKEGTYHDYIMMSILKEEYHAQIPTI